MPPCNFIKSLSPLGLGVRCSVGPSGLWNIRGIFWWLIGTVLTIIPYHLMSCHVISCQVMSCYVLLCHTTSQHNITSHRMIASHGIAWYNTAHSTQHTESIKYHSWRAFYFHNNDNKYNALRILCQLLLTWPKSDTISLTPLVLCSACFLLHLVRW